MTWFKVDDGLHAHQKWLATSMAARGLWVTAGSWCADQLTDGRIPAHVLRQLGGRPRDADELVRLGLWDTTPDGWTFHDWAEFQPSAASVEAERAAARDRQRRARDKARESRTKSRRDIRRDSHVSNGASHGPPDPTRPTEEPTSSSEEPGPPDPPDDDDHAQQRPDPPPVVGQAVAILAARDLAARQATDHLPPLGDPTAWENTAYRRRLATAWPIVELHRQHPDWDAQQLADFAEPPPTASPDPHEPPRPADWAPAPFLDLETDGKGLAAARDALRRPAT